MQKKALEINLYVAGAGAFAVFLRWLQDQLAFNELGLAERSAFHFFVLLFLAAAAYVFLRFLRQLREQGLVLPTEFCEALANPGRLFALLRLALGALMCAGAALLFFSAGEDKYPVMLRALAVLGALVGLSFPLLLSAANRGRAPSGFVCLLSMLPLLLYALWLLVSYRENSINSVAWAYALDIFTPIMAMLAFFRLAGFAFGSVNARKVMFNSMFGAMLCMMALADERYMGMQLMLAATAGMLLLYSWLLVLNLRQAETRRSRSRRQEDGFERL